MIVIIEWSVLTYFIHGVPVNTIMRSRKHPEALADMHGMFELYRRRWMRSIPSDASVPLGFAAFIFAGMAVLGFRFNVELAQAVFGLLFPIVIVVWMNSRRLKTSFHYDLSEHNLRRFLLGTRRRIQSFGLFWVFILSIWGTYQNWMRLYSINF